MTYASSTLLPASISIIASGIELRSLSVNDGGRGTFITRDVGANEVVLTDDGVVGVDITEQRKLHNEFLRPAFTDALIWTCVVASRPEVDLRSPKFAHLYPHKSTNHPLCAQHERQLKSLRSCIIGLGSKFARLLEPRTSKFHDLRGMALLWARVELNGFSLQTPDQHYHMMLSLQSSLINHSCEPNVVSMGALIPIDEAHVQLVMTVTSLRPLVANEQLFISYLHMHNGELTWDVIKRRQRLREGWGFECRCRRCLRESDRA
jgi:hypothetical protein